MDTYRIDSHKLMYHIDRVQQWLRGTDIYPIYVELSLTDLCNHKCIFCAYDYLKHKPIFLLQSTFKRLIDSACLKGVKSIMISGAGEPLLHPDIISMIQYTRGKGIDLAITSNAVLFTNTMSGNILHLLTWFRASINAGTARTYAEIHRCSPGDFKTVLKNLEAAVKLKKKKKMRCTLGAQFLLLPQNYGEAGRLIRTVRDIGLDYCSLKPYSQHPMSHNRVRYGSCLEDIKKTAQALTVYSTPEFEVVYRSQTVEHIKEDKPYHRCLGLGFTTMITSNGDMFPCNFFFGNKKFILGNLNKESFEAIWEGRRRAKYMDFFASRWDVANCRKACRLDSMNRYLWELKHPQPHVNFI